MMGSRANEGGTDALSGLLALVSDPKATTAKILEIKAAMGELADARTALHAAQSLHAEKAAELIGAQADLIADRQAVHEQREAIARELAAVEKAKADLEEREAGFVERDRIRDAKALVTRNELRDMKADIDQSRKQLDDDRVWLDERTAFTANVLAQAEAAKAEAEATIEGYKARVTALQSAMNGAI